MNSEKTQLAEGMAANPLDKAVAEDQDVTALAQEGLLTAAAAETDAINQYMQILELVDKSEPWLGEMVKATLEDIISEEKKHFAQLSTIVSKLPAFEEEFKAGAEEAETGEDKEEPKEEVVEESTITEDLTVEDQPETYGKKFDWFKIMEILQNNGMGNDVLNTMEKYNEEWGIGAAIKAVEIDDMFDTCLPVSEEAREKIEQEIITQAALD